MSKHRDQQALNAVEKANNAVGQIDDNPSDQLVEQAENAVIHAQVAVGQAQDAGSESAAVRQAANQVDQDEQIVKANKRQ